MKSVNHKCPSCNANLKYDPKTKGWTCEYCGGKFKLEDLKHNEENFNETKVKKHETKENGLNIEMDEYQCQDCGAKIVADKNTAATFCVYCKNTAILKSRLSDKFAPSKVIPFTKTKEDAIEAFKAVGKGKFLMPKEFALENNIKELSAIYIPFWLYSCEMDGHIKGKGTRVSSWTVGDYRHTKTDTYSVERNGKFKFERIPVDGSIRFNDAIMNSIEPFNYDELCDFSPSYLSGFLAEKYDVESNEAKKISIERAKQSCYKVLNSKINYTGFLPEVKTGNVTTEDIQYVLLPVWMVNVKYKDKFYTFAMNGQTGKMIGDIPYSKSKAFIFWIIMFIVIALITGLITYFV